MPPVYGPSRAWEALTPSLAEWILDAVSDMGYTKMTPVQASTIPEFMQNRDVVVEAVTGSGKTLAYLIPVVERLLRLEAPLKKHHIGAIIISPTRELAAQIHSVLLKLLAFHGPSAAALKCSDEEADDLQNTNHGLEDPSLQSALKVVPQLLLGGNTTTAQDLSYFLKNSPNLVIATPGRLLELLSSQHVHCPQSSFEVLVLDEADRLLDLGFKEDLQKILGRLPKQRRTGLFSASVSEAVDQLIRVGLRNSKKIVVKVKGANGEEDRRTPSSLQMKYLAMPASHTFPAISKLLSALDPKPTKSIIFLSTCAAVDYFQYLLPSILPTIDDHAMVLVPLHGKQPSKVREKNFHKFANAASPSILLTTDVAARGLDIPQVDLVLQIDPPSDAKVFLHRCGRAGRAGRRGLSVVFLEPGRVETEYPGFLERRGTPVSSLDNPAVIVTDEEAGMTAQMMRNAALADRAVHEKAQRAFPSWMKAYSKHQASHIFRINELGWKDLGKAWGLLKLPKMPELKTWEGDRSLGLNIDFATYRYKDKQREKLRQQAMTEHESNDATTPQATSSAKSGQKRAWSDKLEQQEERERRREKKRTKREREKREQMTPTEKEEQRKLEDMIKQVKRKRLEDDQLEEFDGFKD